MSRKRRNPIISTGTTSIVLIFVMLCMLTFSVLSLVSAQADLRLSRLSAERTTSYYTAENAANEILIRIEEAAVELAGQPEQESGTGKAFAASVLRQLDDADEVSLTNDGQLIYQVPLGENQALRVELSVSRSVTDDGHHYVIHAWQTVSGYDWNPDDSLNVGKVGNMPPGFEH